MILHINMLSTYGYQNLLFLYFKHPISRCHFAKFNNYIYLFTFGDLIFLVKKPWIFQTWTFPISNRDFTYQTWKFPKSNLRSRSLRFQAFIWYQICHFLNWCVCHFITIAKSASQSSVPCTLYSLSNFNGLVTIQRCHIFSYFFQEKINAILFFK